MAEPVIINDLAFEPFQGGRGVRFAITTTSGSTAYKIPGLDGEQDNRDARRVIISNSGPNAAYVRMGPSTVVADTSSLEILPGTAYLLMPPDGNPNGIWIAGITADDITSVSVISGKGR